ncbi:MAG: penicillin-binding protein 2 [Bordetella sp. SCN 67-23]|nr:penicillin-binding protein 2 [Burkholderiales bacterium]ODS70675.1 MAG: penicillin-binding protein 2 [Bordetella sp. SCN 67-23]ODU83928.1 MAG: penicillin-binding protein 2 [Bordetella sp. SCN 68-11]OJW94757.1 MAG: penicillin-binding protein 2 [Burkholderiales bacterium 67-32]
MTELKNTERELQHFRLRLLVAVGLVLVCFGLLGSRFWYLQVANHDAYAARAEQNRISVVPITPHRGIVVDRNGAMLARNYSAYTLEITPSKAGKLDETIEQLSGVVNIDARDRRRFRQLLGESRRFESLPIRSRLTDEEVARFAAQAYRFPGVEIRARLLRNYPQGEAAAHVIGYIGRISQRDIGRLEEDGTISNYRGTDYIGKEGLEKSYEAVLHGKTGVEEVEVTASGRAVRTLSRTPPVSGKNLILSIDVELQKIAETAFGNRRGALVAIEPSTGDILAFVSRPSFDPNLFVDGIDVDNWKALNESPDRPLINRPLYGTYPIGSTYKPFMALAGLELGKRTFTGTMYDPGYFEFGDRRYRNSGERAYGTIDMRRALEVSSDTYFYSLAADLGVDAIHDFMKPFGFGQITGIDLGGEKTGILPSTAWKRRAYSKPEQQRWYAGETISIGVGQGYNAFTLLQLAQATSVLANDGVYMKPHLVKSLQDSATGEQTLTVPHESYRIPLKPENIKMIKQAMASVTRSGTAARAFAGAPYVAAGKTGTAQVYSLRTGERYNANRIDERLRDHALFMAFAPLDHPRIAVALIVENAGWGATVAAPVARQVFDFWLLGKRPGGPVPDTPPQPVEASGD